MNIIMKMEEMLKSWFPNVKLQDQLAATKTEEVVPTKKLKVKGCFVVPLFRVLCVSESLTFINYCYGTVKEGLFFSIYF